MKTINTDSGGHDDALGRDRFVRHLLDVIQVIDNKSGAVIGLEGEWGAGKTWILDHLDSFSEDIEERVRPVFVRFNPWMVSGTAEIVESFLIQLASELATASSAGSLKRGAELAERLIDYTRVLSAAKHFAPLANLVLPGSGLFLEAIGVAAGEASNQAQEATGGALAQLKIDPKKLSLSAARKEVVELLVAANKRIVVIIDDLDRLPPEEVAAMVQAVKAVADFPNLIYLLAYDPEAAANSLRSALRLRAGEGRRYLEKIVQLPLRVPEPPASKMQAFAIGEFTKALGSLVDNGDDKKDLEEALPLAAALMQTPRDVVRLRTRLLVIAKELAGDVNLADVLLVESLNMKAPSLVDYVDCNRPAMLQARIEQYDEDLRYRGDLGDPLSASEAWLSDEDRKKRAQAKKDGWKRFGLSGTKLEIPVAGAMAFLFDAACNEEWGATDVHASRKRLQRLRNWARWRAALRHGESFDNSEIESWISKPELLKASRAWADSESFLEACALISDFADEASEASCQLFAGVFMEAAQRFGDVVVLDFNSGFGPLAALEAVAKQDTQDNRVRAVRRLLSEGSVWQSYRLVAVAHRDTFGGAGRSLEPLSERLIQDEKMVKELARIWTDAAIEELRAIQRPDREHPGFRLADRIIRVGGDLQMVKDAISRMVIEQDHGIEVVFCGREFDDEQIEQLGVSTGSFLPDIGILLEASERLADFETKRTKLVKFWRDQMVARQASSSGTEGR